MARILELVRSGFAGLLKGARGDRVGERKKIGERGSGGGGREGRWGRIKAGRLDKQRVETRSSSARVEN